MYALAWNQPGRRAGLNRDGYKAPSLLQSISSPNNREPVMNTAKDDLSDEDIFALPRDLSDTSSDDERSRRSADIIPTQFNRRGPEEPAAKSIGGKLRTSNKTSIRRDATLTTRTTRASKQTVSNPSNLGPSCSNKRKGGGDSVEFGAAAEGPFGQLKAKKVKKGKTYGSTRQQSSSDFPHSKLLRESPEIKHLKTPTTRDPSSDLDSDAQRPLGIRFKKLDRSEIHSPEKQTSSSPAGTAFKRLDTTEFDSPTRPLDDSSPKSRLRMTDTSGFENHTDESPTSSIKFKKFGVSSRQRPTTSNTPENESPSTQLPIFKKISMDGDLAKRAHDIVGSHTKFLDLAFTQMEEDDDSLASRVDRCPMCKNPVDPEELKSRGDMNIRQQEKFCREHQKKDAKEEWTTKGYPEIDWDSLDTRISRHYGFIKKLVNGANCHYREMLDQKVKAGKDRTLLKSESSLTPGYYGTRGLQAISENLMSKFTPLLKKRVVKDRLMAARGVTGFVQSVLVPEVAILLIEEDMNIVAHEAIAVLKESVNIGELVHEEIRDVVTRRAENSDQEGEDGDEHD